MKNSKTISAVIALSLALASGVHAQSSGKKGMEMKDLPVKDMKGMEAANQNQVHKGSGTVRKMDPGKRFLTIAHGPVKSISWPAMTMTFAVKDKAMLDEIKPGMKVGFSFVQSGKDFWVTEIKAQ
jgi:Cu(I)/Ag(I) efflux system protein CusF